MQRVCMYFASKFYPFIFTNIILVLLNPTTIFKLNPKNHYNFCIYKTNAYEYYVLCKVKQCIIS